MSKLTDNIQHYAKLRGMNLQEVAEKAGLSQNIVYRWKMKGSNPSVPSINSIAKVLDVSTEQLTGNAKKKEPTKIDLGVALDNSDDVIMTFEGKPIPEEDKELIKRLLRGK